MFSTVSVVVPYLRSQLNDELKGTLMIDEYQFIPGIATMLKLLVDSHDKLRILCSGSSSLDVLQKVDESMAGRVRVIHVYSLSFHEYLRFADESLFKLFTGYDGDFPYESIVPEIVRHFDDFIVYGGLPRVVLQPDHGEKRELLNDIYKTYLLRDVRTFIRNEDSVTFNRMLRLLANQSGNLVNTHELSRSSGLTYRKTEEYLWLLKQCISSYSWEPYLSKRKSVIKMRKVFFTDNGLRNIITGDLSSFDVHPDHGSLFENTIFLELRKSVPGSVPIRFFRTLEGTEIDFIIGDGKEQSAVEVKSAILYSPGRIGKLKRLLQDELIEKGFLISKNLNTHADGIRFVPGILSSKVIY